MQTIRTLPTLFAVTALLSLAACRTTHNSVPPPDLTAAKAGVTGAQATGDRVRTIIKEVRVTGAAADDPRLEEMDAKMSQQATELFFVNNSLKVESEKATRIASENKRLVSEGETKDEAIAKLTGENRELKKIKVWHPLIMKALLAVSWAITILSIVCGWTLNTFTGVFRRKATA